LSANELFITVILTCGRIQKNFYITLRGYMASKQVRTPNMVRIPRGQCTWQPLAPLSAAAALYDIDQRKKDDYVS
jgi:hypothetical protein